MNEPRKIYKTFQSKPALEGAGVRLKRAFAHNEVKLLDPFLLLDDFHSDNPDDYIAGFPTHPHRGIETVTYMLHGQMNHKDSLGNSGIIQGGDIQWMTAGSGIIHSEMPIQTNGLLWGFQLWVNLPAKHKMMPPRYQDITNDQIPHIKLDSGTEIRLLAGTINGIVGPVKNIIADPEYLDISVPPNSSHEHIIKENYTVFAYVIEGSGFFDLEKSKNYSKEQLIVFDKGNSVNIITTSKKVRFLLVSGKPINEPIVWYGPIVMNTKKEIEYAFKEYRNGTFLK
ncbi:MAG: pirin family protein [Candidatus Heimdallarchaeota archaeon]|nr:pirin family protein [Candidatus Heimdallarchaeota archaeon]